MASPHTGNGCGCFALVNIANTDLLRSYTMGKVCGRFAFLCVCTVYLSFCVSGVKLCTPRWPAVLAWLHLKCEASTWKSTCYCFSITMKQPHTFPTLCSNPCATATLKVESQQLPAVWMTNTGTRQEMGQTVDRDTGQLFQASRPCTIHHIIFMFLCMRKSFQLWTWNFQKCKEGIIKFIFNVEKKTVGKSVIKQLI